MIRIGRVKKPWGLKGDLVIDYYGSQEFPYKEIFLRLGGEYVQFKVKRVRSGKKIVVSLEGIESIDQAEKIKGVPIFVKREDFPETEEDEYYWVDLIGLKVEREDGEALGEVVNIIPVSSADILEVKGEKEYLIPMHYRFIKEISLEKRKILVKAVKGVTFIED